MTSQPAGEPDPRPKTPERRTITVRRAPKFVPFLVIGALLGLIAAALVTVLGPGSADYDRSAVFGYFTALLAIPGVLLGGITALLLDRLSVRRSRRAVVEASESDTPEA
jgi:hypothetical protein